MHRQRFIDWKTLSEVVRLLIGHRDDEVGFCEQLRMTLEVGRSRFVADIDTNVTQRHPGVERDQRTVAGVRSDTRRPHSNVIDEATAVQFAEHQMLRHHTARRVGGTNQQDGTKARLRFRHRS
jgi:hypothetical protein